MSLTTTIMLAATMHAVIMGVCTVYLAEAARAEIAELKAKRVTCEECRWWDRHEPVPRCINHHGRTCGLPTPPDWFCADGEREGE